MTTLFNKEHNVMSQQEDQLKAQIESDPRVQQLARSRQRGSMPGVVSAAELRQMGYPVTDNGWKYFASPLAKYGNPRVIDENDKWDRLVMAAALGVMTAGAGMELAAAAGGGSAAAGPSAASEVAGVDATVGGMGAGGWGTGAGVAGAVTPTRQVAEEVLLGIGAGLGGAADAAAYNRGERFNADVTSAALKQRAENDYNTSLIDRHWHWPRRVAGQGRRSEHSHAARQQRHRGTDSEAHSAQ